MNPTSKTLVVIGGGAAGFFCAVNAARINPNLRVIILEKTSKLLSKVKVSGGGRCNVTHSCFEISTMSKSYPRGGNFLKKAFHQFFTTDTLEWFGERGVTIKAEADGRMFPDTNDSQTIINCLVREANRYQVEVMMNTTITGFRKNGNKWILETNNREVPDADYVCIACGGFPKAEQFNWLASLGHSIEPPVPSLFTFNLPKHPITALMGVSIDKAQVKLNGTKLEQTGSVLITHWGLSGPAILKLSAWGARDLAAANYHFTATINWLSKFHEQSLASQFQLWRREKAAQKIDARNMLGLPQRLWEFLLTESGITPGTRWTDVPAREMNRLVKNCCSYTVDINGKTTFKEEFVTAGGVQLADVNVTTMESRLQTGIYFAGEILDVDGITGGYNFQNAWTTGFIAAQAIAAVAG